MTLSTNDGSPTRSGPGWLAGRRVGRAAAAIIAFVALLWVLEGVDTVMNNALDQWGIRPRQEEGLRGIAFAPLLHGGWQHLAANSVPALVLGFVGLVAGAARFVVATALIWLFSGAGVWLTGGTNTLVVGLSGVIFGWMTYLVARGLFTRKIVDVVVGLALLVVYGGMLWGVFPGDPGISWQAHLWGAVGGVIAAVWLGRRSRAAVRSRKSSEVGSIAS